MFVCLSLYILGCKDDPVSPIALQAPAVAKAVYVLNEGNFGQIEARLSVYDIIRDTVYRDVFEGANGGQHLGSVGDDMKFLNGKAYILMSGSENLNVVSITDNILLQSVSFPGNSPHDLIIDSLHNRIFITRLFKNSLYVLDLSTLAIIDSVGVGSNPQGMVISGNDLFVCNSGYGSDSTISIVDVVSDTVKATIRVGFGPAGIAIAPDGKIWISCTGNAFGSPPSHGRVYVLNSSSYAIEDSIVFTENLWGNITMSSDGFANIIGTTSGSFYGGPIHRINTATKAVTLNFISGTYYSAAVYGVTEDIYVADVKNFSTDGVINVYSRTGSAKRSFTVQKGPGVIAFKY